MSNLKEIGIGAMRPGRTPAGHHLPSVGHSSPRSDADSHHSRYSQRLFPLDYFEDEEEMEEILECRVFREDKYQLLETIEMLRLLEQQEELAATDDTLRKTGQALVKGKDFIVKRGVKKFTKDKIVQKTAKDLVKAGVHATEKEAVHALASMEKEALKAGVGAMKPSFLARVPFLGKLAGTAIPVVDIAVGTAFLLSACKQINKFNKKFNKQLNLEIGSELPNYLVDASERQFDEFLEYLTKALEIDDNLKSVITTDFNNILETIKDLVMTILVAAQPYATAVLGSELPVIGNIIGYVGGKFAGIAATLAIHAIPIERLLFELASEFSEGILSAINIFESEAELSNATAKIERNSLAWCFFSSPIQTFSRLGQIYDILQGVTSNITKALDVAKSAKSAAEFVTENSLYDFTFEEDLRLIEDYASRANAFNDKMVASSNKRKQSQRDLPDLEDYLKDNLSEFSGAIALGGGPVPPVGYTAKGKPETPTQRQKRQRFNIEKSYPYTRLANPPKSTKKRRKKRK